MPQKRVLVVDDDSATALLCSRLLQKAGYATIIARDAGQAVAQAHRDQPALIVTDLKKPVEPAALLDAVREAIGEPA